jgi:hypothetical protein
LAEIRQYPVVPDAVIAIGNLARLLDASGGPGASGLVTSLQGFAFALAPMTPQHYRWQ